MNDLRVTMIEPDTYWRDVEANLQQLDALLDTLLRDQQATDIVILPEMFTTGFTMEPHGIADGKGKRVKDWMHEKASMLHAAIVGSVVVSEAGEYFNRLYWVSPESRIYQYDKRHPFRMSGEHEHYRRGQERLTVNFREWNICPLICYDLRFPVWSRNRVLPVTNQLEVDVLIYVANWPASRSATWQTLLQARAIENSCYCIGVNRIGVDGNRVRYEGLSVAFSPGGDELSAVRTECSRCATLSADHLCTHRREFPAHLDADQFELTDRI